jgi:hypothetical protein
MKKKKKPDLVTLKNSYLMASQDVTWDCSCRAAAANSLLKKNATNEITHTTKY